MDTLAPRPDLARRFFSASKQMLCILDREGRILVGNSEWTAIMGKPTDEPLPERAFDITQAVKFRENLRDRDRCCWSGYLRTAKGHAEGFQLIWGADDDDVLHVVVRQLGVQAPQDAANARESAMTRQTDLGIIELHISGEVFSWNPAAEAIFGYSADQAIGNHLTDLVSRSSHTQLRSMISDALQDGRVARFINTNRTRDGRVITCAWRFILPCDDVGMPINIVCFVQDVTDVEAQRRALEEHAQYLDAVLQGSPIMFWVLDRHGVFTISRGSALKKIGREEGQVVGKSVFELYERYPSICHSIREALSGKPSCLQHESNGFVWQSHMTPLVNGAGELTGVLGVSYDVSPQVNLAREQREHLTQLLQQQETIRSLSTPILQVWDGVLVLPLIGQIDERRAEQLMDALLGEVVRAGARYAILDVTGVGAMDAATVSHLGKLLRAIRLLGAEGILTGVRPAVAQSLVTLGEGLTGVLTLRDLQAGLQRCMNRLPGR